MPTAMTSRGRWLITITATIALIAALLLSGPARTLAQDEATPDATPGTTSTVESAAEPGTSDASDDQPVTATEESTEASTPAFDSGDIARVADGPLNVRDAAGLDAEVVVQVAIGTRLQITSGPVESDGYSWYEVETTAGDAGWVAADFLEADSASVFSAGATVVVLDGPLNVREEATLSGSIIDQLPTAELADILAGPISADDYTWYQVESEAGVSGWVAGEFLGREGDDLPAGDDGGESAGFAIGDAARATVEDLNFRADPSTEAEVLDTIDLDALFLIRDGPVSADGYTWYFVFNYYYGEGWVAGELLALEPDGFPGESGA
jgi:uncharacterized protein YgiM (DUF1202 family)